VRAAATEHHGQVLAEANASLTTYTGLIESARANNRQGFPVGIGYLKNASTVLRSQVTRWPGSVPPTSRGSRPS
jgi:hypothetical protein